MTLLTVIHTLGTLPGERAATGWMLPGATRAILDLDEETASEYLETLAAGQRGHGIKVSTNVRRGDPAQQVLSTAHSLGVDLIVLGTHGKGGMKAFWAGSVAPKIVVEAKMPLLLVPVRKD
jgi:nucleotide-binding universal stress UspA family protein